MKAHLINTHPVVPRSCSSAKVKVKYQGHVSQKMGVSGALVFHKHILFINYFINPLPYNYKFDALEEKKKTSENIEGKKGNAGNQHFLLFPQSFLPYQRQISCFNPFPNKPWFLLVCSTGLLKTPWEKEKLLVMSNFSFFHSVFCHFGELSASFIKFEIVVCNLF